MRYCWSRSSASSSVEPERRHEERHRGDEADVHEEREADVEQRVACRAREDARATSGLPALTAATWNTRPLELHLSPWRRTGSANCCAPESSAHGCVLPAAIASCERHLRLAGDLDRARRARQDARR